MKKTVFAGSATALVTPMKEDLSIDFDLFGTLIQEQIRHGTDALVVAGTTGESATLTDEEIIGDAMGIFQQVYPNTVKIDYDNSHTREIEQVDLSHIVENKSFSELISDFYQLMYQCEISEEEMDYMKMAAREAGVIHETE